MAALIVAVGAAIVLTADKIHDHKEKKRALKAQEELQRNLAEDVSIFDGTMIHHSMKNPPAYHEDNLPHYHKADQHPASRHNKQSTDPRVKA